MALVLTGTSGASNLDSTNGLQFATWTTGTRPASPIVGQMGYNTTTGLFDQYTAGGWVSGLTNATQSIPFAALPTGSVLQVVQTVNTTVISTTSTTFVTTGFSASITPLFSTSKVLALVSGGNIYQNTAAFGGRLTLYRGATNLAAGNNGFSVIQAASSDLQVGQSFNYLDSPATTSSTTYTLYYRTGSGTLGINTVNGILTITLLEIAA